jgi:monovalent cation/hydrogen antiporter
MQGSNIHAMEIVLLLLLLFVVAFGELARRLKTPYPIVLVVGGLLVSFIPGIPRIMLNPDVIFLVVLPPLLFSAAWLTSWREFSFHFVSIFLLAFGLVGFTVLGVAYAAPWFLPGFDWRMGLVLGAVVAPTDAIAAASIAKRIGLPKRVVDILEGESLVNDATALLALEFGIALLVGNRTSTVTSGFLRLTYLIVAGIAIGLVIGVVVDWIEHRVDDAPIEIALSILTPYVAYLSADSVRASGVLAVVACGLYLSRMSSHFFSPSVRLQAWAVWDSLTFILNGFVFVLVGLQLPYVLDAIKDHTRREILLYGALFTALLILLRLVWVFPGGSLAYLIRRHILHQNVRMPSLQQFAIVGWTGMRGVISLAAAIALPQMLGENHPFTQRNLMVFLAFCVILVTLVLQGLTLPTLIRALGLAGDTGADSEEKEARRLILEAALVHLEEARAKDGSEFAEVYNDLAHHYRHRLATVSESGSLESSSASVHYARAMDISRDLLRVERRTAVRLRNQRRISDEVLRELEHELDLSEARLSPAKRSDEYREPHHQ